MSLTITYAGIEAGLLPLHKYENVFRKTTHLLAVDLLRPQTLDLAGLHANFP